MQWKHVIRKINEIKPQAKNPRVLSKKDREALFKGLEKFGIAEPICITKEGVIIGGHQRYAYFKHKKAKEIHCWECQQSLSEKEIEELTIRLNRNHGEFDFEMLANGYSLDDLIDWGFDLGEFHLENNPEQEHPPTRFTLTIEFESIDTLNEGEKYIQDYLIRTDSGTYKVKIA